MLRTGRLACVVLAALAVAACQQSANTAKEANPDAKPGLSASDAVLVLPAVKGNPGAAYFTLTNTGGKDTALAAVSIDGAARTEMHQTSAEGMSMMETVPVKAGETVKFVPGGSHVMVFELADKLAAGGTAEMTLVFADGDKLSATIPVKGAGEIADGHGDAH